MPQRDCHAKELSQKEFLKAALGKSHPNQALYSLILGGFVRLLVSGAVLKQHRFLV